jgi:MFS family permease
MSRTSQRRDGAGVALACTTQFVDVVGVTVLIVGLPAIQRDLRLSAESLSWVAAVYALIFGGFLVLGGRAVDLLGQRSMFVLGSALVAVGSLLGAIAGTAAGLIAGRALQGLGAAVSVPAALAVVLSTSTGHERSRALGLWTMAGAVGGASGFVIGGLVTQFAGWRWLFVAIGPLALAAAVLAPALLEPSAPSDRSGMARGRPDLPGGLLSTVAIALVILGFNRAQTRGFADPSAWLPLVLAPLAVLAFRVVERRARAPLIPPALWSISSFRVGAGVAVVLTATTSGASVIGSLFLQHVLGVSAGASGASFLLFSLSVVVGSAAAPAVLQRVGPLRAMAAGLAVIAVSMGIEAYGVFQRALPLFLAGLSLSGLGLGVASVASTAHGTADATDVTAGVIGGLLNAAAQIGTAIGIAVLLATATHRYSGAGATNARAGQVAAYLLAAGVALAAMLMTTRRRPASG